MIHFYPCHGCLSYSWVLFLLGAVVCTLLLWSVLGNIDTLTHSLIYPLLDNGKHQLVRLFTVGGNHRAWGEHENIKQTDPRWDFLLAFLLHQLWLRRSEYVIGEDSTYDVVFLSVVHFNAEVCLRILIRIVLEYAILCPWSAFQVDSSMEGWSVPGCYT